MSLRATINHRFDFDVSSDSDVSSTIYEDMTTKTTMKKELLGNIIVCTEDNPYLDNIDNIDGNKMSYSGNINELFMFDEVDDLFSDDHFWNNPSFAKHYAVLYNRNLRHLKYHSRRNCHNSVGGKELRCRCLSVLGRNEELLQQTTEMMTSFQVCQMDRIVMEGMNITIDLSPEKISRFMLDRLESLKLWSGGNGNTPLGKQKGISYSSKGGAMQWNIFKFIESHYQKTMNNKQQYKYVCKSTVKKIFGMKKEQWDKIVGKQHTPKKHAAIMNTEQKIASEGNYGNRRSSRLKITIGIHYEGDDDGSIDENKKSSNFDTAEEKNHQQ